MSHTPPSAGDASGVLDMQVLDALRELGGEEDPGLLAEIVGIFLEDAPARLAEMQAGLASADWPRVERAAHSLKSASANVGASGLSGLLRQIEESARRGFVQDVGPLLAETERVWPRVEAALRALGS